MARTRDGSAGDADYGRIGSRYSVYRRPEPEVAAAVLDALGSARSVINIGAGSGSYEPTDREVVAVEPSETMRAQRPPTLGAAVDATAEDIPFEDAAFDAAMATFSVHQWSDLEAGLSEMRRVARGPVVILTADPDLLHRFWLVDYLPEVIQVEASRYPRPGQIAAILGGKVSVKQVPIPLECKDGFAEAYYGRPEMLLDKGAQQAMSAWSFLAPEVIHRFETQLRNDLASGRWDEKYGDLRTQRHFRGSLVLIVGAG